MGIISTDIQDHIATVKIVRPEARNAIPLEGWRELHTALDQLASDRNVTAIVLTGTGEAFAAGDDIKEVAELVEGADQDSGSLMDVRDITLLIQQVSRDIVSMPKPVIAAVNGWALGAGFELALICDFIYAAESARFGFPETGIGMTLTGGVTKVGSHLMPLCMLRELVYTGRYISAGEALDIGFVNRVIADDELVAEAEKTAAQIAGRAPIAVGFIKDAFNQGLESSLSTSLSLETEMVLASLATKDCPEGARAFRERRSPRFRNR